MEEQAQGLDREHDSQADMPHEDRKSLLDDYGMRDFTRLECVTINSYYCSAVEAGWIRAGVRFCAGKRDLKVMFRREA